MDDFCSAGEGRILFLLGYSNLWFVSALDFHCTPLHVGSSSLRCFHGSVLMYLRWRVPRPLLSKWPGILYPRKWFAVLFSWYTMSKTLNGENLPKISPLVPRTLYLLLLSLVVMEPLTFQAPSDILMMGVSWTERALLARKAFSALFAPKSPNEPILRCDLLSSSKVERFPEFQGLSPWFLPSLFPQQNIQAGSPPASARKYSQRVPSSWIIFHKQYSKSQACQARSEGWVPAPDFTRPYIHCVLLVWVLLHANCCLCPWFPQPPVRTGGAGAVTPASHMKASQVPEFKRPSWEKRISFRVFVTSRPKKRSWV